MASIVAGAPARAYGGDGKHRCVRPVAESSVAPLPPAEASPTAKRGDALHHAGPWARR
ncbi:hypothetical protein LA76x_0823 [Lysobacter antibioticus]|uniref:Uncharacterized protein n=2 Tax=Lysobacter antibioticus TaxID=84531 RepID=A0A0S2F611_LYSAN|nr:hypothetical protein LA76x_0823 [Lysobacter antibioticus]